MQKTKLAIAGNLLINKPAGLSSFQCVKKVRYESRVQKVGHAGTLDPFAQGLMLIAVGKTYTKQISSIVDMSKTYWVSMILGISTNTLDSYGQVEHVEPLAKAISMDEIKSILQSFLGKQEQVPPKFSAKKINGKRAYDLARNNEDVVLKPASIEIYDIELLSIYESEFPEIQFKVTCSKGTYVRTLVEDIAKKLGTIAYTKDLIREKIGNFDLDESLDFKDISEKNLMELLQFYGRR